ncbi:unnamed protein product [Adineta steineri]|uniref:CDV3-like protein n=1 Tax=Adineta steineri TaxID=433720 RepID=A0A815P6M3_9BILA|nr:unnamed protein product [Adineta steineri]CAF1628878.1 unnamed protein product [Adineta steineri]
MAANDDLDDFFKKKDRKGNKHKKQTPLLTNNEELLKQLVIVTSATSAFKENPDNIDDDDEQQINEEPFVGSASIVEDTHKHSKTKVADTNKHLNEQQINIASKTEGQPQDEWEEFEDSKSKYEQLRLKISRGNNDNDDDDDDYYDDENNPNNNYTNNDASVDREQQKDKPVWKLNQIKEEQQQQQQQQEPKQAEPIVQEKVEEVKPATASTGAYRPPQMRSGGASSSVTVVSGINPKVSKKKEPNLASTDEFPTLGATVHKK